MVELQILSKVLATKDNSIITDNLLTEEYFVKYRDCFNFIQEHVEKYGNVPDEATFLSNFTDEKGNPLVELVEVNETNTYLVNKIREEYLFSKCVPVVQRTAELLKTDSNAAAEYLMHELPNLEPNYDIDGIDIIANAQDRYEQFIDRKSHQENWFFESGYKELDELIHGIQRGEELLVIVARTNQGKSWILEHMCAHVWKTGFNVGYMSPEMSANSIGFRFDTLFNNFSNSGLMWGKNDVEDSEYEDYIKSLPEKHKNKFIVSTPKMFGDAVTVTKLKNWVKKFKLDMIGIDGITYLSDERYKRGDNKTTSLTNISEDLMSLSVELGIPILVVVQANRGGVKDDPNASPELEDIRDSDGISHNASTVISVKQKTNNVLDLVVKKQRFGARDKKVSYIWDINKGKFEWIPSNDDEPEIKSERKIDETKKKFQDKSDVF